MRVALVVSRWNPLVTERLLNGALEALLAAGLADADVDLLRVPGAFEIPMAARAAAARGNVQAVVCLGCLIRGATAHFDHIASACAHGITSASLATGVPMTFGVLTTNTLEEALERAGGREGNKGQEAASAALEMIALFARMAEGTR